MLRQLNTQSPPLVVRRMRKFVFLFGQKQFDDSNQTFGWQIFHRLSFLRLVPTGGAARYRTLAFPSFSSKF